MPTLDPIRPVTDAAVNTISDKVGNPVGTLWDYSLGLVVNIVFLSRTADEIAEEMERLQSLRDDLKHRAEDEARRTQANVSNQLLWWMSRVSSLAEDASNFGRSFDGGSTCITRFRLGYDAVELLKQARKLAEEGNVFSGGAPLLTRPRAPDPVEQVPSETWSSTLAGGRGALQLLVSAEVGILIGTMCDYSLGLMWNIIFLSRKADEVAEEMERLQSLGDYLKHRAEDEARQTQTNVPNQLVRWMSRVSSLAADASNFERSFDGGSTCVTRFRLGYDALELLKQARKLAEEGKCVPLTCPRGPDPVEQVPFDTSSSTIVGRMETLQLVVSAEVGNLVGTICDYSLGLVVNIIFLSRKADEIAGEMERLQSLGDDLKHRAEDEARQTQTNVPNQLVRWMSTVSSLAADASNFEKSFDGGSTCICRICLGCKTVNLLRQARKLAEEANAFSGGAPLLTRPRGLDPVKQVPSETPSSALAGGKEALQQVQSCIMDDGVGIVGIYGMGGVGKTTLLKIINNEFLRGSRACRDKFDVAIWVTVSRDVQISSIRETIADRLGLPSDASKDELFDQLSKKRFVLFFDDVWEKLDFTEMGIPLPQTMNHRSKILFTTRHEQVCGEMDADEKVEINSLDDKSSWDLFRSKLGRGAAALDNPSIRRLAEEVVRRCGGLPIALVTMGRAMSTTKTVYDWKDAIRKLDR